MYRTWYQLAPSLIAVVQAPAHKRQSLFGGPFPCHRPPFENEAAQAPVIQAVLIGKVEDVVGVRMYRRYVPDQFCEPRSTIDCDVCGQVCLVELGRIVECCAAHAAGLVRITKDPEDHRQIWQSRDLRIMNKVNRWRSVGLQLILAQDPLECRAGLDEGAGVHGRKSQHPVCGELKGGISGSFGSKLGLGRQTLHVLVVASDEMVDELAAQCREQGVHVVEFMAERVSPGKAVPSCGAVYP